MPTMVTQEPLGVECVFSDGRRAEFALDGLPNPRLTNPHPPNRCQPNRCQPSRCQPSPMHRGRRTPGRLPLPGHSALAGRGLRCSARPRWP